MEEVHGLSSISLTEKETQDIEAYCDIARANGAILSLRELIKLTSIEASEEEMEFALASNSQLSSRFMLESGYVLERFPGADPAEVRERIQEERRNRDRAEKNIQTAADFAKLISSDALLVSVSGANSYLSAREMDDIDFFCVTSTSGMWRFMLRALLIARIYSLTRRAKPPVDLSCIMDYSESMRQFSQPKDALFARDALTANVVHGREAYRELLGRATWIEAFYPRFYRRRLEESGAGGATTNTESVRVLDRVVNSFLYRTVGKYVMLKSWILNRRFRKYGKGQSIFHARVEENLCIFESNRYRRLRGVYSTLDDGDGRGS